MIIHNCEQGTDEWFEVRKGKMTASNAQAIAANGKGLETYIYKVCADAYARVKMETYKSQAMERGNELEDEARSVYAINNGVNVTKVGFIEYNEYVGCSPDSLVDEDGGLEVKCINNYDYFKHLVNGISEIDSSHTWQVQMCLLVSGRAWWDYLLYNPNFDQSTIIYRIFPDPVAHKKLLVGFEIGIEKIKQINNKLNK